jgi:hypothetical protein
MIAAEVYSPLGGVDRGSIYKRGGRYSPEFLWNTNWQDQVQHAQLSLAVDAPLTFEVNRQTGRIAATMKTAARPSPQMAVMTVMSSIVYCPLHLIGVRVTCSWRWRRTWSGSGWRRRGRTRSRPPATSASAASSTSTGPLLSEMLTRLINGRCAHMPCCMRC